MKKLESFESNVKAMEVAKLFGSKSMNTSHYLIINDVLVRISNHYPDVSNLKNYNNLDELKGIVFVFVGENPDKFQDRMENDRDFEDLNINIVCFDLEEDDNDYIMKTINRKVNSLL